MEENDKIYNKSNCDKRKIIHIQTKSKVFYIAMRKTLIIILLSVLISLSANAQSEIKRVYNEEINPLEQIDNALALAKSSDKYVVCQLGGNWCPWCLIFADFVTKDSTISKLIDENFVYIHVNYNPRVTADKDKAQQNAKLLQRLDNPSRFGYPVFIVLDEKGKVLHIQDSSFLEEGKGYNQEKVLRFFKNWTPKAVKGSTK